MQGYPSSKITVLTTYSDQVRLLCDMIRTGDRNSSRNDEVVNCPAILSREDEPSVRITTVDNFQGEGNDIILLSLVRRLWKNIVNDADKRQSVGSKLILTCQTHKNSTYVSKPDDFDLVTDGGCQKPCKIKRQCGHICLRKCHVDDPDHEGICPNQCHRKVCEMGHSCIKPCHYPNSCEKCNAIVVKTIPKCQHRKRMPCHEDPQSESCDERCQAIISCGHRCQKRCTDPCYIEDDCKALVKINARCGHEVHAPCYTKYDAPCKLPCKGILKCGHVCKGTHSECSQGRLHKPCEAKCERKLVCGHICKDYCNNRCPPCTQICDRKCIHGDRCKTDVVIAVYSVLNFVNGHVKQNVQTNSSVAKYSNELKLINKNVCEVFRTIRNIEEGTDLNEKRNDTRQKFTDYEIDLLHDIFTKLEEKVENARSADVLNMIVDQLTFYEEIHSLRHETIPFECRRLLKALFNRLETWVFLMRSTYAKQEHNECYLEIRRLQLILDIHKFKTEVYARDEGLALPNIIENYLLKLESIEVVEEEELSKMRKETYEVSSRMIGLTLKEKQMIKPAMRIEFSGSGHWYKCKKGHYYSIGECGMPMEKINCPQCGLFVRHSIDYSGVDFDALSVIIKHEDEANNDVINTSHFSKEGQTSNNIQCTSNKKPNITDINKSTKDAYRRSILELQGAELFHGRDRRDTNFDRNKDRKSTKSPRSAAYRERSSLRHTHEQQRGQVSRRHAYHKSSHLSSNHNYELHYEQNPTFDNRSRSNVESNTEYDRNIQRTHELERSHEHTWHGASSNSNNKLCRWQNPSFDRTLRLNDDINSEYDRNSQRTPEKESNFENIWQGVSSNRNYDICREQNHTFDRRSRSNYDINTEYDNNSMSTYEIESYYETTWHEGSLNRSFELCRGQNALDNSRFCSNVDSNNDYNRNIQGTRELESRYDLCGEQNPTLDRRSRSNDDINTEKYEPYRGHSPSFDKRSRSNVHTEYDRNIQRTHENINRPISNKETYEYRSNSKSNVVSTLQYTSKRKLFRQNSQNGLQKIDLEKLSKMDTDSLAAHLSTYRKELDTYLFGDLGREQMSLLLQVMCQLCECKRKLLVQKALNPLKERRFFVRQDIKNIIYELRVQFDEEKIQILKKLLLLMKGLVYHVNTGPADLITSLDSLERCVNEKLKDENQQRELKALIQQIRDKWDSGKTLCNENKLNISHIARSY
ncbi:unnamed protein product [Mytilus coruscus]|uniref:RZ-type domain-containing protein n=1 Tax=Mytilus coruscus TaxID=42192 RepID=A0A6J8EFC9_MYTCO|nr:unnamed protein product [Mytilus coruscus]